ncbi:MAG: hypothetical protein JWP92_894 [Caulobacter sp.]|nr:hypothetical protein [Caulobacter sp.]
MPDPASENLTALWIEVFGEAPSIRAEPRLMAQILVAHLASPGPYRLDRMAGADDPSPAPARRPS